MPINFSSLHNGGFYFVRYAESMGIVSQAVFLVDFDKILVDIDKFW